MKRTCLILIVLLLLNVYSINSLKFQSLTKNRKGAVSLENHITNLANALIDSIENIFYFGDYSEIAAQTIRDQLLDEWKLVDSEIFNFFIFVLGAHSMIIDEIVEIGGGEQLALGLKKILNQANEDYQWNLKSKDIDQFIKNFLFSDEEGSNTAFLQMTRKMSTNSKI